MFKEVIQQINGAKALKMKKQFDHELYLPTINGMLRYKIDIAHKFIKI